jgi:hypothetical protein
VGGICVGGVRRLHKVRANIRRHYTK